MKRRYVGPNEWLDEWLERLGEPWAHCAIRDSGAAALQSCLIGSQSAAKFEALSGYLHTWGRGRGRSPREENLSDFRVKTAISTLRYNLTPTPPATRSSTPQSTCGYHARCSTCTVKLEVRLRAERPLLRPALRCRKLQPVEAHRVVHDDERRAVEQRVRASSRKCHSTPPLPAPALCIHLSSHLSTPRGYTRDPFSIFRLVTTPRLAEYCTNPSCIITYSKYVSGFMTHRGVAW